MKNPTIKIILFGLICFLVLLAIKECGEPKQHPTTTNKTALELSEKQHGHEVAILLNEITEMNKRLMDANSKIEAAKTREIALTDKNIALIKKLRQNAPKECQLFIDSTNNYHLEIEAAKDSSYSILLDAKMLSDSGLVVRDSAIVELQGQVSDLRALRVADKEDLKQAERRAKIARFFNKVLVGAAIVATGVVMWVTVVK